MRSSSSEPLWVPGPERIARSRLDIHRRARHPDLADSDQFWSWSVAQPEEFWAEVWDHAGLIGDRGDRLVEESSEFWKWRFLPDATMNVAENLLADREGAAAEAVVWRRETEPNVLSRGTNFDRR